MPGTISPLFAIHIADGMLTWPWLYGGFAIAAVLAFLGSLRIRDEEIPQVAVLTAAFFVACQIGVPVPPVSVHLLLNGLMGLVLRWRAALAIPVGLALQAALFGHGGFTTLGINSCVMVLPALLAWQLFAGLQRVPWLRQRWFRAGLVALSVSLWTVSLLIGVVLVLAETRFSWLLVNLHQALPAFGVPSAPATPIDWMLAVVFHPVVLAGVFAVAALAAWVALHLDHAPEFPVGLLLGQVAVLATSILNCFVLALGGKEDWHKLAQIVFIAHLPVAAIEGIVLGFTVSFLARVKPEMLRWAVPKENTCPVHYIP